MYINDDCGWISLIAFTILKQFVNINGFIFNFATLLLLFVNIKFIVFLVSTLTSPKSISVLSKTNVFSTQQVWTSKNEVFNLIWFWSIELIFSLSIWFL